MTGARKALIVACDTYDQEGLRRLRSPRADAAALAAVLGDPQIGGFDVDVVHNEPAHEVQGRVEELFAECRPDDLLLLHLACHGLKSESGELFFAARNTRLSRLASTAVSADFVQRCMRASRSRSIVLLLDCCYGGAFGAGVSVRAAGPVDVVGSFPAGLEGGRGRAVITASSAMEYAFEGETLADDRSAPSVFTEALVRGLSTGEADRDEDGWVSLNELYDYVFDQVRTTTPSQTPTRDVEMQGELYLARSRRRRIQPAPVPPDLLAASHDANVFTRLGAVSELRTRLLGANLPAAAGAHERLVEMAELDIRYVADAATAAVADAHLTVHPLALELGEVVEGASSPRGHVTVTGPPLARTCTFEPSDPRIRVEEGGDGFAVLVDTSVVGRLDGSVTMRGPLGGAVVEVHVDVTQPVVAPGPVTPDVAAPPDAAPQTAAAPDVAPDVVAPHVVTPDGVATAVTAPTTAPGPAASAPPARASSTTVPASPSASVRPADAPRTGARADVLRGRVGAVLTLAGSGVLVWGAFSRFRSQTPMQDYDPWWFRHAVVVAATVAVAAVVVLVPRTRWPAGVGLLLGVLVASTWDLVTLLTAWVVYAQDAGDTNPGFWLLVVGHGVTLVGGAVVAREVAGPAGGRVGVPVLPRPVVWSLVGAGVAGAVAVVVSATRPDDDPLPWYMTAWTVLTVTAVPLVVAFLRPARFGAWVLVGWVAGAAVAVPRYGEILAFEGGTQDGDATVWIGVAVLLLVPLAVVLWRVGGPTGPPGDRQAGTTDDAGPATDHVR